MTASDLAPQNSQAAKQASVRAVTGTANTWEGDWHALFDANSIPAGTFDERLLRYLNIKLSSSYTNLPEAMQAIAVANGAANWSSLGTFTAAASADSFKGITVGSAGTGDYSGFTLAAADDFDVVPTRFAPADNPTGRYGVATLRGRRSTQTGDLEIFLDPYYRGAESQTYDALSAYDGMSFSGGAAVATIQAPPAALLKYLPTTNYTPGNAGDYGGRPKIISGQLCTHPSAMFSAKGDFIVEGEVEVPSTHVAGLWVSLWTTTTSLWPDYGEIDINEIFGGVGITGDLGNLIVSNTDGGGAASNQVDSFDTNTGLIISRKVWWRVRKIGNTVYFDDDIAVQGTLANRGSYTDATRVGRLRGGHDMRLQSAIGFGGGPASINTSYSDFNAAQFPCQVKFHGWAMWVPTGRPANSPLVQIATVQTTAGGSWATTIPSMNTIWGTGDPAPDLCEATGFFDNNDAPGCATKNSTSGIPGGMSVTVPTASGTGSVSGTVPTGRGGRTGLWLVGSHNAGGMAKRAVIWFDVAPVETSLFDNQTVALSSTGSIVVSYEMFHSGNLPHTYTVTSDKSWAVVTMGAGNKSATIDWTAPASDDTATLTITATNTSGQFLTVTRTIAAAAAAWTPASWSTLLSWYDPNDNTKVFNDNVNTTPQYYAVADTDVVGRWSDKKSGRDLTVGTSVAGRRPSYVTDGGRKVLAFDGSKPQLLTRESSSDYGTQMGGNDTPFSIVMLLRRGVTGQLSRVWDAHNTTGGSLIEGGFDTSNNVKMVRNGTTAGNTTGSGSPDAWMVISWIFAGTTLTIRKNGTVIANGVALDTASLTITGFVLGAAKTSQFVYRDGFNAMIDQWFFSSDASATSNVTAAESYLMSLRGL